MIPNTATQIAGRAFANCIMNAAGVCDYTRADLDAMQNSSAASFVTKSATVSPREGNPNRATATPLGAASIPWVCPISDCPII